MMAFFGGVASSLQIANAETTERDRTFGEDVEFLAAHVEMVVLGRRTDGPRLVLVPAYQARVMTSSATGEQGSSYGWINYKHIASGIKTSQINVYGGEERMWLGPEGGQFGLFFEPGAEFDFESWRTPPVLDTESFKLVTADDSSAAFRKEASLVNYSSATFDVCIERRVQLLSTEQAAESLGVSFDSVRFVGYRSTNRLTNAGVEPWTKATGLLSLWMLGMYKPGPNTTVVIPFQQGPAEQHGPIVNDAYFGKPCPDRLKISDGVLFFRGDGQSRAKIGLSSQRALNICGSYDGKQKVLTIVKHMKPPGNVSDYVNSMWKMQNQPYAGDAVNAYNDGPPSPDGEPLGPFYELETSSPALSLRPGETGEHMQETYHFEGSTAELDSISRRLLGASIEQIESSLR